MRQFAVDRSLWVDEALLARNVLERDLAGLLQPLSGQQGAPVGYLWMLKGVVTVFGEDEMWMRLPSLVAGLCLLPLVWLLALRLFSRRAAAVATALVAVTPGLVRYSFELKQYSIDATVAVALVLVAHAVDEEATPRRYLWLGIAGVLAVWFSHPAILVLAGVGLVLLVRRLRVGDRRGLAAVVAIGTSWLASLGALYLVSLRDLTDNEFLTSYWAAGFPDSLRPDRFLGWVWSATVELLGGLGGVEVPVLAVLGVGVAAVAAVAGAQGHRMALVLAFVPALLLASSLEQYPYRDRLALFALPFLLVALASLIELPARVPRGAAAALLLVAAAGPVAESADRVVDPLRFPDSRPVIAHVAEHVRPDDRIFVHGLADAPFSVYGPRFGLTADAHLAWRPPRNCEGPSSLAEETGAAWVVFAYTHSANPPDEASILRTHLAIVGHRTDLVEGHDAFAARYDLDAPPDDPTGAQRRTTPTTGCLRILGR